MYSARDLLTGDDVVVKVLPVLSAAARRRVNLEVTALRGLRMPGVVRVRDDVLIDDRIVLVMDRVVGRPFPVGPVSWEQLRATTLSILETLDAVHAAGVVHRDLKPGNILIDSTDRPVLIDFGLTHGAAIISRRERRRRGTVQYRSPEQLSDEPCGPASDLYSLAAVVYETLCGFPPHGNDWREIVRRRTRGEVPPAPVGVPSEVADTLMAMLAPNPADRPSSAAEVIERMGGMGMDSRVERLCKSLPGKSSALELRDLFCGPDLFMHLREDAAELLHARTRGLRDAVQRELCRWLRQGLARHEAGLLRVSRSSIQRLQSPPRLRTELPPAAIQALAEDAVALEAKGGIARASGCIRRAIDLARRFEHFDRWEELLPRLAVLSMKDPSEGALNRMMAELGRAAGAGLEVGSLDGLVRGLWLARRGEALRAQEFLIHRQEDPELERLRIAGCRIANMAVAQEWLDAVRETPDGFAQVADWEGVEAYEAGRYAEALAHHEAALQRVQDAGLRLKVLINAASAALEVDLVRCEQLASSAQVIAGRHREARGEAHANGLWRAARYRRGLLHRAEPERVYAAAELGPWTVLQHAVTEGAIAWRSGDLEVGVDMALRGAAAAKALGLGDAVDLCYALARVCGAPVTAPWRNTLRVPSLAIQALALRALADPDFDAHRSAELAALADAPEFPSHGGRMDVLSPSESLFACTHHGLPEA